MQRCHGSQNLMETAMFSLTAHGPARLARPRLTARGIVAFLVALDSRYRARVRLAELDERMLADIGVSRAEVDAELRRPLLN